MEAVSEEEPLPQEASPNLYDDKGNPRFFSDPGMDRFVAVVMNLAQEVWVQESRLLDLEEERGAEPVDRDQRAKEFIERVFAPVREA